MIETSLGPSLVEETEDVYSIDLTNLRIFFGLSILSRSLGDEILDKIQNFPGDVFIIHKLNPNLNAELVELHISHIQIYARAGVLKDILLYTSEFQDHLRSVFGTFQRPVWANCIHPEFYGSDPKKEVSKALVFPFHHASQNQNIDYQFILERVPNQVETGTFLLRLTIENPERAKIDLETIPHVIVDDLGERVYIAGSTKISESVTNSVLSACLRSEFHCKEENREFHTVFNQLAKTKLGELLEINFYWNESFSEFCLSQDPRHILLIFKKLFLCLEDTKITESLRKGKTIQVAIGKFTVFIDLSRLDRVLNFSFNKKRITVDLAYYLKRMPMLESVTTKEFEKFSFSNVQVFLIHHITSEILAFAEMIRRKKAKSLEIAFVKYGGPVPPTYLETLLDIPTEWFYMSGLAIKWDPNGKSYYVPSSLYSDPNSILEITKVLEQKKLDFFPAMKLLAGHRFFQYLFLAHKTKNKVILIEDGGYIASFIQRMVHAKYTVQDVMEEYCISESPINPKESFSKILDESFVGSVEHTRNGYDRLVELKKDKIPFFKPVYSIAVSNQKAKEESKEVSHSILHATESILNGLGKILSKRKILLLGSEGNIGSCLQAQLSSQKIDSEFLPLVCVDLKYKTSDSQTQKYIHLKDIPKKDFQEVEIILGVIGISIFTKEFIEDLLLRGKKRDIYFISGSTKTAEFTHLSEWINNLSKENTFHGSKIVLKNSRILDPQTGIDQGGQIDFRLETPEGVIEKTFYLFSDLRPINFLFYGVPTEGMDPILSQLATSSLGMVKQFEEGTLQKPDLYAVDHQIDSFGNSLNA